MIVDMFELCSLFCEHVILSIKIVYSHIKAISNIIRLNRKGPKFTVGFSNINRAVIEKSCHISNTRSK